jgi:hypothetical protein
MKRIAFCCLILVSATAFAGERGSDDPKSKLAVSATEKRDAALRDALTAYQLAKHSADKQCLIDLQAAQVEAKRRGESAEVQAIDQRIKSLWKELGVADPAPSDQQPQPSIAIQSARYGHDTHWADITSAARGWLDNNTFQLPCKLWIPARVDPEPGRLKNIEVTFKVGNAALKFRAADTDWQSYAARLEVIVPESKDAPASKNDPKPIPSGGKLFGEP